MDEAAGMNILEQMAAVFDARRDQIAIVDMNGTRQTTYGEFATLIGRTAAKLRAMGFAPGSYILIHMSRQMEYIAAYLGFIAGGYAVVPTVLDYPQDRLRYIMEDCASPYMAEDDFFDDIDSYTPWTDYGTLDMEQPVCMNYTSGSTGRPKGVYYTLRTLTKNIPRAALIYEGVSPLISAASASFSFAAMCNDSLSPLFLGGELHVLSDEVRRDVRLMTEYYETHHIRCGNISPAMLRLFGHTTDLQRVFTTGERAVDVYSDQHEIWCVYGLTEAYTVVSGFSIDRPYHNTPIGKPIGDVELAVLDEEGREVPDGTEGEIHVTGYLSEGYFHMPEATEAVFRRLPDGRMRFATRDIGYKNENGDLVYVNRKDWMVKINGQRVEPFEVEAAIAAVPGVQRGAVRDFRNESGSAYLVGYYMGEDVTPDEVRESIRKVLAPYMVPSFILRLDQFPLTVSGKLDRKSLEPPKQGDFLRTYEPPADELEEKLCLAMAALLHLDRIGRKDDFLELGGDSIAIMKLLTAADDNRISVTDIVEGRTPAGIADRIRHVLQPINADREAEYRQQAWPLTSYQLHYYHYQQYAGEIVIGNTPGILSFPRGSVTAEALAEAMERVCEAHPALLTRIHEEDGRLVQRYHPEHLHRPQIRELTEEAFLSLRDTLPQPFHLLEEPLYRCEIFSTEAAVHLFLDVHHIISDAYAERLIEQDLFRALAGEALGEDPCYAWLASREESRYACEPPILPKPETVCRPPFDMDGTGCETSGIIRQTAATGEAVRACAERHHVTVRMLFMAAALRTLGRITDSTDVSVNWLFGGRISALQYRVADLLICAVPTPVDLSQAVDDRALFEEMARVEQRNMACIGHLSLPETSPVYGDSLTINYLTASELEGETRPAGVTYTSLIDKNRANTNAFYIIIKDLDPAKPPTLMFKYNDQVYKEASIQHFVDIYMQELSRLGI
ncbi:MAG: non-ribosomal peptide synthetase [Butyrivibrio sp.]|nr:non-ribosomal peptide synthetase [Butyrivibrio sp.]